MDMRTCYACERTARTGDGCKKIRGPAHFARAGLGRCIGSAGGAGVISSFWARKRWDKGGLGLADWG